MADEGENVVDRAAREARESQASERGPSILEKIRKQLAERQAGISQATGGPVSRVEQLRREGQKNLQQGLAQGRERGEQLFGGGLDLQGINRQNIQALQQQAQGGLGAPQFAQIRGAAEAGLAQQAAQNQRNLLVQQGASGIRGAAAQAGGLRAQQQADIARRNQEAQLAQVSVGLQERGQTALGRQIGRERFGQLSAEFGQGGLASAQLSGARQQALAEQGLLNAQGQLGAPGGGGGGGQSFNPFSQGGVLQTGGGDTNDFLGIKRNTINAKNLFSDQ